MRSALKFGWCSRLGFGMLLLGALRHGGADCLVAVALLRRECLACRRRLDAIVAGTSVILGAASHPGHHCGWRQPRPA